MKDFLLAEYKTIILVLLFCGGVFSWFYVRELQKDAAKAEVKTWEYTCLEPGKAVGAYALGAKVAVDDTWAALNDHVPGMTSYRNKDEDIILNVQDDLIRSIEFYPSEDHQQACKDDMAEWQKLHKVIASPVTSQDIMYTRYSGVVSMKKKVDDAWQTYGWVVTNLYDDKDE